MFNKNTEYAYLILNELKKAKEEGDPVKSLHHIAKLADIKIGFAEQVSRKLRSAGLIKSHRGPGGGYTITDAGCEINLWDLMVAVEPALGTKISKLLSSTKALHYKCAHKIKEVYIF